jgi:hypothetical protein
MLIAGLDAARAVMGAMHSPLSGGEFQKEADGKGAEGVVRGSIKR